MSDKWEYRWIPGTRTDIQEWLDVLGTKGWEAYSVTTDTIIGSTAGTYTVFLKRKIEKSDSADTSKSQ